MWFLVMRSFRAAQLTFLEVKLTQIESWVEISVRSGILAIASLKFLEAVRRVLALSKKPSRPYFMRAAQVPVITAPDLDPAMVGVTYIPPGQDETAKKEALLSSFVLNMIIEHPLGP